MTLLDTALEMDVVILCGGLGLRLRPVLKDKPKVMVGIGDRPFLDLLIKYVASFGFKRFILCAGYQSKHIEDYYKAKKDSLEYVFSIEQEPLGTAGAIKNAESLINSNTFLCFNGDSFCPVNLRALSEFHFVNKSITTIAVTSKKNSDDYGSVELNKKNAIVNFNEKDPSKASELVSAGIYMFDEKVFRQIPSGKASSLEHNIFPDLVKKGISGFLVHQPLFDIGTPERLEFAKVELLKFT